MSENPEQWNESNNVVEWKHLKGVEKEEPHNPANVPMSEMPQGWRFIFPRELDGRFAHIARVWHKESECFLEHFAETAKMPYITYIVPDEMFKPSVENGTLEEGSPPPPTTIAKREEILQKAIQCVTVDRQATHGKPENSFADIAHLWSWWKGIEFTHHDVAVMMGLMKTARIKANPDHEDSYVDNCGYYSLAAELKPQPQ